MLCDRTRTFVNFGPDAGIPQAVKGFRQNVFDFRATALRYVVEETISAAP